MRAAWATYAKHCVIFSITAEDDNGKLLGGGLFQQKGDSVQFLGTGPCDYLDVLVDRTLGESLSQVCKQTILRKAFVGRGRVRELHLKNVTFENRTPQELGRRFDDIHVIAVRSCPAPTMDMSATQEVLRSKSVRRRETRMRRQGRIECQTYVNADDILPRLPEFFDQHVRRWRGTDSPSLFENDIDREFYYRLTLELGGTGLLRYTELRLDDKLAAAHFGFFDAGRFIWYKPSFEPAMAHLSPGVVLLARLIERAILDQADEFDFTIGDEPFKSRYATRQRAVVDLVLTRSACAAIRKRLSLAVLGAMKRMLSAAGMLEYVSGILSA